MCICRKTSSPHRTEKLWGQSVLFSLMSALQMSLWYQCIAIYQQSVLLFTIRRRAGWFRRVHDDSRSQTPVIGNTGRLPGQHDRYHLLAGKSSSAFSFILPDTSAALPLLIAYDNEGRGSCGNAVLGLFFDGFISLRPPLEQPLSGNVKGHWRGTAKVYYNYI